MRLATTQQSREIDSVSQTDYKLPAEILMENAGASAAREMEQIYYPELRRGTTGIVCGPGNNGGDGLVLARHLHGMGHRDIVVFLAPSQKKESELFSLQRERVELQGVHIVHLSQSEEKQKQLLSCEIIVDALFGTGFSGEVNEPFKGLVETINAAKSVVVSLDMPSGLDCDRGFVQGLCVKAQTTLSFGLAKPGFFISEGPLYVGRLRVLPIGFPHEASRNVATSHFAFTERLAKRALPRRKETSNKSSHGHMLLMAGSEGQWGAALLAASAAYRAGVGYVTLTSGGDFSAFLQNLPEVLTCSIDDEKKWLDKKITSFAIGPGFGVSEKLAEVITRLKKEKREKVVLDADALTTCVEYDLFPLPETWVLTPHAGELSRILDIPASQIESDRFRFAREASLKTGCHVLLKGFRSVLAHEDRSMVILSGNSALAKAGTGDVLTGMIGAFMAQGLPTVKATATAAFVHGKLADEWVRMGHDKRALSASDLRDLLPDLLGRMSSRQFV